MHEAQFNISLFTRTVLLISTQLPPHAHHLFSESPLQSQYQSLCLWQDDQQDRDIYTHTDTHKSLGNYTALNRSLIIKPTNFLATVFMRWFYTFTIN